MWPVRSLARFSCLCVLIIAFSLSTHPQANDAGQNQKKARAALDQMIAALGGQAFLNLQDAESKGRSGRFYHGQSEGSTVFHRFWQWPDKERVEWTKQRDVAQLTIGDAMYEITFRGARPIDPQKDSDAQVYLARRHHALEIILRQWLNEPAIALFDEGPSLTENHNVEKITIINARNDSVTLSIDADTHLPVKKTFVMRNPQGYRDEIAEIYDDWKIVQGINTPYNTLVTRNGELERQYFLSSITYNQHLQESLFLPMKAVDRKSQ